MFSPLRQRRAHRWLARLAVAAQAVALSSRVFGNAEPVYHATRWTTEDGLPQMRISALAQTPDGYLWAGTWFGLARFDGARFVVFNSANTPELRNEVITALAVDRADGALWVGTQTGLLRLKDRKFTTLTGAGKLSTADIADLIPAAGGGVWVWIQNEVVLWRNGGFASQALPPPEGHRTGAWETSDGHLIAATSAQRMELTIDGRTREWALPDGGPSDPWKAGVLETTTKGSSRIWVSAASGLFCFAGGTWTQLKRFDPRGRCFDRFLPDREGNVWIACEREGLFHCASTEAHPIALGDRGAEKSINAMLLDREGYVWAGTDAGLFQLRPRVVRAFSVADGMPHRECTSVCEGPDGAIWAETTGGVACVLDGHVRTFADEPRRSPRYSILVSSNKTVWLGDQHNGVIAWRPGVETKRFLADRSPAEGGGETLSALYLGKGGEVWVGTGHGTTWLERGKPSPTWGQYGLPTNSVRVIRETRDGAMWFGTWQAGLVRWERRGTSRRYTVQDGLADNRVFAIYEDSEGTLWIGTHNGLSRLKGGRFFTYRAAQGLFDNTINWMEEDDAGRFWFSCNRGIFRISRGELNAVADGIRSRAASVVYGIGDGMLSPETNGENQPAGCKARDGRMWFPTMDGLVVIDPQTVQDETPAPPVVIEQVVADGETIYGDQVESGTGLASASRRPAQSVQNLHLAAGRGRVLQFRYTASSFVDPKRTRFRYRLAGRDRDWREETAERVAYYTDLRPGDYQFEVKAASARGAWNDQPATFPFTLAPRFSQTLWFPLGWTLAVVGVTGALAIWRLRWQRRALLAEKNTALERERGRIARDLHDDLGASLTGIALELEAAHRVGRAGDGQLADLAGEARTLAHSLRELSWTTNPRCDNVGSLGVFLGELAERFCGAAGLECRLELPPADSATPVPARIRHDLLVLAKESLANAAKHARARILSVRLTETAGALHLEVSDDGAGFDPAKNVAGSGLRNLADRMRNAGGLFEVTSRPKGGTQITATVPLREPKET